ncbi:acyltransferase [Pseudovibrio sp. Ad26]|uniref:acyltransferase n=1 Tax=Pseudovibrio sp. Ad26 TaxID=989410 RepID=UPI0007AE5F7B|nr:acyltransferase [Pseudovibrio sp. Ad26]KZL06471.1 Maltose O-acetyltransferase [Pseudovibrio sp. Ad26]
MFLPDKMKAKQARGVVLPSTPALKLALGEKNYLDISDSSRAKGGILVRRGEGNRVEMQDKSDFVGKIIFDGKRNSVKMGKGCKFRGKILVKGNEQTVSLGDFSSFQRVNILCEEAEYVRIGKYCMFSRNIEVRTSDAHSVIDVESRRRVNKSTPISIGDHVWVGVGVLINKGTALPDDCIVGANSFVNSSFSEERTVIAGSPAVIVKRGVSWHPKKQDEFSEADFKYWQAEAKGRL